MTETDARPCLCLSFTVLNLACCTVAKNAVYPDAGYNGVEKREEYENLQVIWQIAARRSKYSGSISAEWSTTPTRQPIGQKVPGESEEQMQVRRRYRLVLPVLLQAHLKPLQIRACTILVTQIRPACQLKLFACRPLVMENVAIVEACMHLRLSLLHLFIKGARYDNSFPHISSYLLVTSARNCQEGTYVILRQRMS